MKKYLEHVRSKEPHERRKHALQLASVFVGIFFVAWVASFGARLAAVPPQGSPSNSTDLSQAAAAADATAGNDAQASPDASGGAQLEVSTTSVYSY